jgi:hypothetical protein
MQQLVSHPQSASLNREPSIDVPANRHQGCCLIAFFLIYSQLAVTRKPQQLIESSIKPIRGLMNPQSNSIDGTVTGMNE